MGKTKFRVGDSVIHNLGFSGVLTKKVSAPKGTPESWHIKIEEIRNPLLKGFKKPGETTWVFTANLEIVPEKSK